MSLLTITIHECIFGVKEPSDVEKWFLYLCDFYNIKQQEYPQIKEKALVHILESKDNSYFETDAYWRDKYRVANSRTDSSQKEAYNIVSEYYMGCKYWTGAKVPEPEHSYPEILVHLPVNIINSLNYLQFYVEYLYKCY